MYISFRAGTRCSRWSIVSLWEMMELYNTIEQISHRHRLFLGYFLKKKGFQIIFALNTKLTLALLLCLRWSLLQILIHFVSFTPLPIFDTPDFDDLYSKWMSQLKQHFNLIKHVGLGGPIKTISHRIYWLVKSKILN